MNKKAQKSFDVGSFLLNNSVVIMVLIAVVVVSVLRSNFLSAMNFNNLLRNTSARFIIALGVSGCVITRGTDLSAGRAVGFSACLSAALLQRPDASNRVFETLGELPIVLVLLGVIVAMAIIGAINGVIISYLHIPPFIATLGTQTIIYGAGLLFTKSLPIGSLRPDYSAYANGALFNIKLIPYLGLFALVMGVFIWFLYNKTPHGKMMYAIGGNEVAANVSGINVNRTLIVTYSLAGAMYGLAGFLYCAKGGGASVGTVGNGYELEAIAGCVIGGVSVNGGVGRISGILMGVTIFETLKIIMQFLGVSPNWTYIVQGLVIILAVSLDIRKYIAKK
jgi:ABC-type glucose/galactose transport system, permease component